ncbi:thioredoxin [Saccharomycopsis crataegensis]|uniref:Thioredoxin n=1 Tax=Saccharomycopsis crataegensis TaxID=43959 RepID=A0AAV5QII3_9ASCO|nr:thioredoxin [Saccharomycopsis crataegensis]
MVKVLNNAPEFETAIKTDSLVVVDFFATWCGPCKMIAPLLEKFDEKFAAAAFYKLDIDEVPSIAQSQDITAMPTIVLYKGGKEVKRVVGANPAAIQQAISSNL